MSWTLTLRDPPAGRIDMASLVPHLLAGQTEQTVAALPVLAGNRPVPLGDLGAGLELPLEQPPQVVARLANLVGDHKLEPAIQQASLELRIRQQGKHSAIGLHGGDENGARGEGEVEGLVPDLGGSLARRRAGR